MKHHITARNLSDQRRAGPITVFEPFWNLAQVLDRKGFYHMTTAFVYTPLFNDFLKSANRGLSSTAPPTSLTPQLACSRWYLPVKENVSRFRKSSPVFEKGVDTFVLRHVLTQMQKGSPPLLSLLSKVEENLRFWRQESRMHALQRSDEWVHRRRDQVSSKNRSPKDRPFVP